jgi:predicted DNA-binding transcriptional regulator AlpA
MIRAALAISSQAAALQHQAKPLSRTAIYRLIAEGQFPRQVCIGPRTVAWCQEDLDAWIEQRIQAAMSEPAGRP